MRPLLVVLLLALATSACSSNPDCENPRCSDDALQLFTCEDGEPVTVECMRSQGQLCEAGACVQVTRFGSPLYPTCENEPHATRESLAEKAAHYDAIAPRLHLHPSLGWVLNVTLTASVAEGQATHEDVERWNSGENDGLWSALYLTSQAYRYAVTKDAEALANIKVLLAAEVKRMSITGVRGVFTRQLIPPGIRGLSCPTEDARYTTDAEKNDNKWVQIRDDGCVWVVDRDTMLWTKSDHCGLDQFKGWCWLDNVSKDEYSGHMLALAALLRLVDDPEVQATTKDLLTQVGEHLKANDLKIVDWDGRVTEHGKFSPIALDDFPGFNAAMAMAYVRAAAEASGSAELKQFYDRCLLQRDGGEQCLGFDVPEPFTSHLEAAGMYIGREGCESNYNNLSMHMLSLHTLLWFERDPSTRKIIQQSLDKDVFRADEPRAMIKQHNALFDFIWAANKQLGPGSDGPALDVVNDGICQLKQFRASQSQVEITLDPKYQPYCKSRSDRDVSQYPRQSYERCAATFVWWGDPYSLDTCGMTNPREVRQPAGYLLPYWMGRYYGFISEAL